MNFKDILVILSLVLFPIGGYYFDFLNFPELIGVILAIIVGGVLSEPTLKLLSKNKKAN